MHCTALSKPCGISSTPRRGTKPLKHSTGLTISRAKPFPCFCTSYGGLPLNAAFAGRLGISALDDDGRAILVALGFMDFAFHQNRNGPVNDESARARESTPTERLRAMR